nr:DUF2165 family protein [Pseudomonas sp.]
MAVFNNLTASTSKFNFVQHVPSMDATFSDEAAVSRAMPAPDVRRTSCRSAASTSGARRGHECRAGEYAPLCCHGFKCQFSTAQEVFLACRQAVFYPYPMVGVGR